MVRISVNSGVRLIAGAVFMASSIILFFWLCSVHRIRNVEEVGIVLNTMMLPHHNDRCKIVDETHLRCLPNVFVIGASKCGTTSIVDYMKNMNSSFHFVERGVTDWNDHQAEIHRFDRNSYGVAIPQLDREVEYSTSPLVRSASEFVVHYTPHYLYAPTVPYEMRQFYPNRKELKFIVLLREPLDRALSSYGFFHSALFNKNYSGSSADFVKQAEKEIKNRKQYEQCMVEKLHKSTVLHLYDDPEGKCRRLNYSDINTYDFSASVPIPRSVTVGESSGRTFHRAISRSVELLYRFCASDSNPKDILTERLVRQDIRLKQKKRREVLHKATTECFGDLLRSTKLGRRHIDKSVYIDQLVRWLSNFDRGQFHFIAMKDLAKQPAVEMKKLLVFLGSSSAEEAQEMLNAAARGVIQQSKVKPFEVEMPATATAEERIDKLLEHKQMGHMARAVDNIPFEKLHRLSKPNPLQADIINGLTGEQRDMLQQYFRPYNDMLVRLLNRTFW